MFVIVELRRRAHPGANMLKLLKVMREDSDYELMPRITAADAHVALVVANFIWPTI